MTCGDGVDDTKLRAIIEIVGIDSVSIALGLRLERVRAMCDGTADIDPESAACIHREEQRLKQAGIWVEEVETPEPEFIVSDDATTAVTEITVPDAIPQDVEDPRAALRKLVEGVLALLVLRKGEAYSGMGDRMSKYEHALFDVLRYRLQLALNFRRPLGTGEDWAKESAVSRRDFIRSLKSDLRNAETQLKEDRGPFHFLRNLPDPSGNETYRSLSSSGVKKREPTPSGHLSWAWKGSANFCTPKCPTKTPRGCRGSVGWSGWLRKPSLKRSI